MLSKPEGLDDPLDKAGAGRQRFKDHVFGTFTAAKERIVQAGRASLARNDGFVELFEAEDIVAEPATACLPEASLNHVSSFLERMINGVYYYVPKQKRSSQLNCLALVVQFYTLLQCFGTAFVIASPLILLPSTPPLPGGAVSAGGGFSYALSTEAESRSHQHFSIMAYQDVGRSTLRRKRNR